MDTIEKQDISFALRELQVLLRENALDSQTMQAEAKANIARLLTALVEQLKNQKPVSLNIPSSPKKQVFLISHGKDGKIATITVSEE